MREIAGDCLQMIGVLSRNGVTLEGFQELQVARATGKVLLQPQLELSAKRAEMAAALLSSFVGKLFDKEKEKLTVFRLGYTLLRYSLGDFVFAEELDEVLKGDRANMSTSCCLLHALDSIAEAQSLHLYLMARRRLSQPYQDFLCHCLKLVSAQRLSLESLRYHPFLTEERQSKLELKDLLQLMSWAPEPKDFSKVEHAIDMVLSNCSHMTMPQLENKTVQALAEQTRLEAATVERKIRGLYVAYAR